jgi:uncharacterized membrane protein
MLIALLSSLIGFTSGLRSLIPPAILCWSASLGWLPLSQTKLAFIGKPPALALVTLLAVGELIADKLPQTPARTKPIGLIARVFSGSACAIAIAISARVSWYWAAILGGIGAIAGAFAAYNARRLLVARTGVRDIFIAVCEDVIAILTSLLIVFSR